MIENEILMVNKLVKTNKINYDNYLLKMVHLNIG